MRKFISVFFFLVCASQVHSPVHIRRSHFTSTRDQVHFLSLQIHCFRSDYKRIVRTIKMEEESGSKSIADSNGTHRENGFVTTVEFTERFAFPNLPYRDPLDLQFKDITYTVKMGWNKGEWRTSCKHISNIETISLTVN